MRFSRKAIASRSLRSATQRRLRLNLEVLEGRRLLTADLGPDVKPPVDLDLESPSPFHYIADGRPIGLSPVVGEWLLGTRAELGFDLAELFSSNPVALGIAVDSDAQLGVSREVKPGLWWLNDFQPLSNRLVSLNVTPDADWSAGLAELISSFTADNSPSPNDFWTAPVLLNAESGLRQWVTDEVIVRLEPSVDPDLFFSDTMFAGYRNLSGTTDQFVARVRDASGMEALEFTNQVLPNLPGVVWSTVNFVAEAKPAFAPNDPFYASQWHLNNFGQSGATPDADIDADLAWDTVTGNPGVVIAVIDDGFQTGHPDLDFWVNPNESSNGADSDGNGWIDDINGLNLVDAGVSTDNPNSNNPNPTNPNENHGTAVAGSAATRSNNALGVASPAFGAKIMGLKPFACTTPGGGCTTSFESVAKTVYYAAGRTANGTGTWRGADVINISYSMSPNSVDTSAFNWATTNGRNGLGTPVFASTGNGASGAEFARVDISVPTSLSPGAQIEFRYTKDGSLNSGDDRVWINWARFPSGSVERFDNVAGPTGWAGGGNASWVWNTVPPETARAHGTGRYPVRSGGITHNQTSSIFTPEFNSSGGFDFRYWISSEAGFDKLEVFVRYRDFFGSWGSWTATNFTTWDSNGNPTANSSASGIADFTPNAAYPANLASVIGVGASTDWDYKSDYSQYGPGLDFVAPSGGGNVDFWTTDRTGSAGYDNASDYVAVQGTSFASPLAAGVGALMLSRNPNLTASQLRTIMQNTAEEVGSATYSGGVNTFYGHGRINAHQAVLSAGVDSNDRISNATTISVNSTVNGRLTTTTDVNMYQINVNNGDRISIDIDHYAPDINTDTYLRVFDSSGNQLAFSDDTTGPAPETNIREPYVEFTAPGNGSYYIGVSAFDNQNYNPTNGTGKTNATTARLGNFELRVNNVSSAMLLVNLANDSGDGRYFNGVTLREAIDFANQSFLTPTIQFDTAGLFSTPQTISLSGGQGALTITRSMTINGADAVTVNAQNASRVFNIDDGTGTKRNVTITGMTIRGGNATNGGGILNRENLVLTEVHLTQNTASGDGGGLWDIGDAVLSRTAVTSNTANRGGGIFQTGGAMFVEESTISGNNAPTGGGINNYFGTANIAHSTISGNQSGVWSFGNAGYAQTNVNHSIISGNASGDVVRHGSYTNTFNSGGYNIVGGGTAIGAFNQPGDQVGVNPLLGTLGNNGGPTPTYQLLPGSPAINRGNPSIASPPALDQRGTGFPRIRGGVIDIGAVEAHPPVIEVIGNVAQPSMTQRNYDLRANEVVFYQFTLASPIQAASDQFLVIDTLGTTGVNQDTEIGLYSSSGNRIANNDIGGFPGGDFYLSRLGFGDTKDSFGDLSAGTYYLSVSAYDTTFGNTDFNVTSTSSNVGHVRVKIELGSAVVPATIVDSFVNHGGYSGGGSSINAGKELAHETGSPTQLTYDNLINSSRGLNGLVFDVQDLAGTVTAADFVFQMSPTGAFDEGTNPVVGWAPAPPPTSVDVTPGSPDRIAITWADNAIANRWLRVTVLATANTGLPANEVYYVGHLLGETTGPSGSVFTVSFADITPIRSAAGNTVDASSIVDIDKNGTVSFADISAMRPNVGSQLTIITIPAAGGEIAAPMFGGLGDTGSKKDSTNRLADWNSLAEPLMNTIDGQPSLRAIGLRERKEQLNALFAPIQHTADMQSEKTAGLAGATTLKDWLFGQTEQSPTSRSQFNNSTESESLALEFEQKGLRQQKPVLEALDAFFEKY